MIYLANDHGGVKLKNKIIKFLEKNSFKFENLGTDTEKSVSYVDYAKKLTLEVLKDNSNLGILICKSGIGMSIAANKVKGIRAGLCFNAEMAKLCRMHNNCNVLVLGSKTKNVNKIIKNFLTAKFEGGRHLDRVNSLED